MTVPLKAVMWAIVGRHGLYTGTWLRRIDAIVSHIHDKRLPNEPALPRFPSQGGLNPTQATAWCRCQRNGDRAVKVIVTWYTQ